jgi:hypothetical protein
MEAYTIYYYPSCYMEAESLVRDEKIPLVDKVLSVRKERLGGDIFRSISLSVYRWEDVFIVKHSVDYLHKIDEDDVFLAVLTLGQKKIAIVDWIDLSRGSVFILPFLFLNDYLENLVKKGWSLSLVFESDVDKKKRKFGLNFSCMKKKFSEEWKELKECKKGAEK